MRVRGDYKSPDTLKDALADMYGRVKQLRRKMLLVALIAAATVIITAAQQDPLFTSIADIAEAPSGKRNRPVSAASPFAGDVGTEGLALLVTHPKGTLYPLILGSRSVSEEVLLSTYRYSVGGREVITNLYDYLEVGNRDSAIMILKSRIVRFGLDPRTGVTRIAATTTSPELSYQIVKRYIAALESCIGRMREGTIRMNLAAIEEKLNESNAALKMNEEALQALRERNRDFKYVHDPQFYLEQMQIEREIQMEASIVVSLKSQYELAMTELLNSGRRVSVISHPTIAPAFDSPNLKRALFLAIGCGLIAAFLLVVGATAQSYLSEKEKWKALLTEFASGLLPGFIAKRLSLRLRRVTNSP